MRKTSKTSREQRDKPNASISGETAKSEDLSKPSRSGKASTPAKVSRGKGRAKKATNGAKDTTVKKGSQRKKGAEPSDEDIRLRAYFIAERRLQLSIPGDAAHDWIEARRQLLAEAEKRRA